MAARAESRGEAELELAARGLCARSVLRSQVRLLRLRFIGWCRSSRRPILECTRTRDRDRASANRKMSTRSLSVGERRRGSIGVSYPDLPRSSSAGSS